jgi:hypothetical protein
VNEISAKYQVSKTLGRTWVEKQRLFLSLDGLDEVDPKDRADCVNALNDFVEQIGLSGLEVCSSLHEYFHLPKHLKLSGAICLQSQTCVRGGLRAFPGLYKIRLRGLQHHGSWVH